MDISDLGKTFDQIEQEVQKIESEIELYRSKIIKLNEKNRLEKYKRIDGVRAANIAYKVKDEFKKICDPSTIFKNVSIFKTYRISYFYSAILTRNEMIISGDTNLVYSYLFLVSHYIELIIKAVLLNRNEGVKPTHNIADIFSKNKEYLLGIGLQSNYFCYCLEQIRKLDKYAKTEDFSMCFRYPIDNDFKEKIITENLINITINELRQIAEEHRYLMIILELLLELSEKHFYEAVYKFITNFFNECEININK